MVDTPTPHLVGDFGQKALIVKDEKVLMCRGVGKTIWDFPGGRVHTGEDLKESLIRELKEELGVETEIGEPFFVTIWYGAPSGMPRIHVVYHVLLGEPRAQFSIKKDEIEEVRWIGKDDFSTLDISEVWKPALYKFFAIQSFLPKPHQRG